MSDASPSPLVQVDNLSVRFVSRESTVHAVNDISLRVDPGEVLCIIGESGSGKSVSMKALIRLLPERHAKISGSIKIDGRDVLSLRSKELASLRGGLASMVFQEPMTALDPVYTVGQQVAETVKRHEGCTYEAGLRRALDLLELVKVPSAKRRLQAYPHELSGGLRQRAMIAMALSCSPKLLMADEPTTALDATVQVQVLILLRKLQRELGMGVMFVTHDLGVAAEVADRVAVMYAGRIVETGSVSDVLGNPQHPYTQGMLASTVHGNMRGQDIEAIPGSPPDLRVLPSGCSFAPRCGHVQSACIEALPPAVSVGAGRMTRCIRVSPENLSEPVAVA
ncbi:MAG: ABC transporter ATP-binding protein [Gammaproteobacteria bacterium]|nr:ABC transporter ATP-binding protein [Gammaproteobacteria bacterium]